MQDADRLIREVQRYLRAVEAFRAEGHEPSWRAEQPAPAGTPSPRRLLSGSTTALGRLDPG
ncbi:MAG TPA: hypothetical protein VHP82_11960 [Gaiellaceae bacterium]|nr:hypothetical protein [Gaiellaceae bacterium]